MHGSPTRGIQRVVAVVAITVAGLFALNLSSLVVANRRAEAVEAALATRVALEGGALENLEAETDRARADAYVEEYIRDRRNWSLPGDRVVLPVPESSDATGPAPVTAVSAPPGFWDRLRRWLGNSPAVGATEDPSVAEQPTASAVAPAAP